MSSKAWKCASSQADSTAYPVHQSPAAASADASDSGSFPIVGAFVYAQEEDLPCYVAALPLRRIFVDDPQPTFPRLRPAGLLPICSPIRAPPRDYSPRLAGSRQPKWKTGEGRFTLSSMLKLRSGKNCLIRENLQNPNKNKKVRKFALTPWL
jgi:hypothetical protein